MPRHIAIAANPSSTECCLINAVDRQTSTEKRVTQVLVRTCASFSFKKTDVMAMD